MENNIDKNGEQIHIASLELANAIKDLIDPKECKVVVFYIYYDPKIGSFQLGHNGNMDMLQKMGAVQFMSHMVKKEFISNNFEADD